MTFKIISGIVLTVIVLFIINVIRTIMIRPSFGSVEKRIKFKWSDILRAKIEYRYFRVKNSIYRGLMFMVRLNKTEQREFQRYIDRLNLKWGNEPLDPRFIKVDQYFYCLVWMLGGLIAMSFMPLVGLLLLVSSPIGYKAPLIEMKDKVEKIDRIISHEFVSFYSLIYYQFRKENKMLTSVVKEYLPNASKEFGFELKIFLNNLLRGEEYALIELRKRLPLKYIIRFCDIMKVRVSGIENISQMMYLKEEMHDMERHRIKKALGRRKKQAIGLQTLVYLLLVQFIIVYWYLQLNNVGDILSK